MGFFSRKENKVYSLEQALKLLKMPQYAKYTTVPVGDGFKLVPEKEVDIYNDEIETNGFKQRRENLVSQLSGEGRYSNISTVPNYNNYQSARSYQKQSYRSLGR